jgi:hypothetical protein
MVWGVTWADMLLAVISVFFVSFVSCTAFMLVSGSVGVTSLTISLVSALLFVFSEMWTRDSKLRTHLSMVLPWSMVLSGDYGILTALIYNAVQIGGAAAAGAFAYALGISTSVLGSGVTPTSTTAFLVSWFAASVVATTYVLLQKWRQDYESNTDNHSRAVYVSAIAIFALLLATFGANAGELRTFEPTFYVANYVATGFDFNWAAYNFGLLFAAAGTATLMYMVTVGLYALSSTVVIRGSGPEYMPANDADGNPNTVNSRVSVDARRRHAGPMSADY